MWPLIERYLPEFDSAVLSGLDTVGYPFSLRCRPELDPAAECLRLDLPPAVPLQPGPACLLCHTHDERLWNLKSLVVRGRLARQGERWAFVPERFVPGMGIGGWRSYVHFVRQGRAATRRYFARRGLPQPHVDWDSLLGFLHEG
jgi:hypothetical protein